MLRNANRNFTPIELRSMRLKLSIGNKELFSTYPNTEQTTVGTVLLSLKSSHPDIYKAMCDEKGQMKQSLTVLVNGENIRYRKGHESELNDGDEVYIIPLIAGG